MPKSLKHKILRERGVTLQRGTRKPLTIDESPSFFPKTRLMKYIELKYGDRVENLIATGTIYELSARLGIDPTTISKWRKLIRQAREGKFYEQFK